MKQIAEALVECGYAHSKGVRIKSNTPAILKSDGRTVDINPFADTLEGRRQADALAEWFFNKHRSIWDALQFMKRDEPYNNHAHLCKQLKTGFEQLEGVKDDT